MRMHNPQSPGEIINELCLEPLGLMVMEAVKEAVCARIGSW
jgi:plasmid maintenance system antidote protein VapI